MRDLVLDLHPTRELEKNNPSLCGNFFQCLEFLEHIWVKWILIFIFFIFTCLCFHLLIDDLQKNPFISNKKFYILYKTWLDLDH